ncbi:MAG: prepilin peptidase [Sphingomonadaceae bacterium]
MISGSVLPFDPSVSALLASAGAAAAVAALLIAGASDLAERRIPNRVSLAVALAAIPMLLLLSPAAAFVRLALALVAGAALALAFARGLVGGGDVKLLSAALLWVSPATLPLFLLVQAGVTLLLALALVMRRWMHARMHAGLRVAHGANAGMGAAGTVTAAESLPLGTAIAAGAIAAILLELGWLDLGRLGIAQPGAG